MVKAALDFKAPETSLVNTPSSKPYFPVLLPKRALNHGMRDLRLRAGAGSFTVSEGLLWGSGLFFFGGGLGLAMQA